MGRITLVCTVHREMGLCNEHELIRILEGIGPDVIFEEIRPSDFESHYRDEAKHTLEMRAVSRYAKARPARQVPVDDFVIPDNFPIAIDILFDYVERNSIAYRAFIAERDQKTSQFGFDYLNSPGFEVLSRKSHEELARIIGLSRREDLIRTHTTWNDLLRRRDASMLENIYDFCRRSPFTDGVFLVGAEHMSSIVQDIEGRVKIEPTLVEWSIWKRL